MRRYRLCVARKVRDPFWVVASWAFVLVAFRDGPRNIQGVSSVVDQCRSVSPKSFLGVRSGAVRCGRLVPVKIVCQQEGSFVASQERVLPVRIVRCELDKVERESRLYLLLLLLL
jgi:hypothetical protein